MPSSRGSLQPRDQTHVSCIASEFFTILATREAQESGVGSLSLLQGIFPAQELNQSLLHCRQILHQLRYQGSPCLLQAMKYVIHYVFKTQCTYLNLRKLFLKKKTNHHPVEYQRSLITDHCNKSNKHLKYCKNYQNVTQRCKVSKYCWEKSTDTVDLQYCVSFRCTTQ